MPCLDDVKPYTKRSLWPEVVKNNRYPISTVLQSGTFVLHGGEKNYVKIKPRGHFQKDIPQTNSQ